MSNDHQNGNTRAITKKDAMGDIEAAASGETAIAVLSSRETAMIQARIVQAVKRPRVFETVRETFKADCERPAFALVARFAKPQGWLKDPESNQEIRDADGNRIRNFVRGWSIRAIESAVRAMGNIDMSATTIFEDGTKEIVDCRVWDLETNNTQSAQITVEKTVERRYLARGQKPIRSRTNSYGDTVHLVEATEDEIRMKRARLVSMTLRTLAQRMIPGDLLDEFLESVESLKRKAEADLKKGILADPKAALRTLLDKLADIGVRAADVVEYLGGRSVETATAEQILELRVIGADITAGNYTWRDALAGSPYREPSKDEPEEDLDDKAKEARARIAAKVAETKAKRSAKAAPEPAAPPPPAPEPVGRQPGDD